VDFLVLVDEKELSRLSDRVRKSVSDV